MERYPVLALDESLAEHRLMLWLNQCVPGAEVVSRCNSILGLVQAAKSGIGLAPLPMAIAEEAGLVAVLGPIPELARTWKLLTHPALRRSPRIAAFFDFIGRERQTMKTIFG